MLDNAFQPKSPPSETSRKIAAEALGKYFQAAIRLVAPKPAGDNAKISDPPGRWQIGQGSHIPTVNALRENAAVRVFTWQRSSARDYDQAIAFGLDMIGDQTRWNQ